MKEINDIKESKIINLLIPEAINQNNQLRKEIRQRIRLNKIFNEFENKASNEFNYFINESNQRYNNLKNGHKLKNSLINSRQKNIDEAHKILQDPFYNNFDYEKEKVKMKLVKTKILNKNIAPLLTKMKQPETINLKNIEIKNFDKNEEMYDLEYNINSNKKNSNYKEYIKSIINNSKRTKNYWSKKPTSITWKKHMIKFKKDLFEIDRDKNIINKFFKKEESLVNKSVNNYKQILQTEDNSLLSRKEISNNAIRLPRLKLLNYKIQKNIKNNDIKDLNKNKINYNYLLSFSDKSLYKQNIKKDFPIEENVKEIKNEISAPILTDINSLSYNFKNYGDTLNIVVNSAKKELSKENVINSKMKNLEKIIGLENTPNLKYYDDILQRKSASIKNQRRHKAMKLLERQKFLGGNNKYTFNLKLDNNLQLLDKVFKNIDI